MHCLSSLFPSEPPSPLSLVLSSPCANICALVGGLSCCGCWTSLTLGETIFIGVTTCSLKKGIPPKQALPYKLKKPRTYRDSSKDLSLEGKVDIDTQGPIVTDTDKPTEGKKEKINDEQGQTGPLSQDLYLEGKSHVEDSPHQLATPSECTLLIKASHH